MSGEFDMVDLLLLLLLLLLQYSYLFKIPHPKYKIWVDGKNNLAMANLYYYYSNNYYSYLFYYNINYLI